MKAGFIVCGMGFEISNSKYQLKFLEIKLQSVKRVNKSDSELPPAFVDTKLSYIFTQITKRGNQFMRKKADRIRRHLSIGYLAPVEFKKPHYAA